MVFFIILQHLISPVKIMLFRTLRPMIKRILLIACCSFIRVACAQIHFPYGNVLNLNTSNELVYMETRILFNTGKYQSDDYCWKKISDSLDSRWLVTSCFNGDCRNDLLQSGCFIRDFGLNDTTCFLAFHVESHGYEGNSLIRYHVFNKNDSNDNADLIYNIHYYNPSEINEPGINTFSIAPNPFLTELFILPAQPMDKTIVRVKNILGQTLMVRIFDTFDKTTIDLSALDNGLYILEIDASGGVTTKKIIKQ